MNTTLKTSLLSLCMIGQVQAVDWTAPDKLLHAKYGIAIGAGSVTALNFAGYKGSRPLTATFIVMGAATGKELYDYSSYGVFDWADLAATVIPGALAAYGADWVVNWQVKPLKDGALIQYKARW